MRILSAPYTRLRDAARRLLSAPYTRLCDAARRSPLLPQPLRGAMRHRPSADSEARPDAVDIPGARADTGGREDKIGRETF